MVDIANKTLYELLGLDSTATTEQIRDAYREIARIFHPDSNFYSDIVEDRATEDDSDVFKAITNAYQTLIDEEKRQAYDDSLPKNLPTWDTLGADSDEIFSEVSGVYQPDEEGTIQPRAAQKPVIPDDLPDDWKKEREYFEEHFDEIMRPAPKVDLIGREAALALETWDEPPTLHGERFGSVASDDELASIDQVPVTRRGVPMGLRRDPFHMILYFGLPTLFMLIVIEVFILF